MRPVADRSIRRALIRIDKGLTVEFFDPPGRFAVCHGDQLPAHPDQYADALAHEIQRSAAANGHIWGLDDCVDAAKKSLRDSRIVFYVTHPDGSFRQPGWEDVKKIERMDWLRKNLGLGDWKRMHTAQQDIMKARRERDTNSIYESIKRDPVFLRHVSDLLWGIRPVRSIHLERSKLDEAAELLESADAGPSAGPGTPEHRVGADHAPVPDGPPPAA